MSTLRKRNGVTARDMAALDAIDRILVEGVEACLPSQYLLRSAPCSPDDATARLKRLVQQGILELESQAAPAVAVATTPVANRPVQAALGAQARAASVSRSMTELPAVKVTGVDDGRPNYERHAVERPAAQRPISTERPVVRPETPSVRAPAPSATRANERSPAPSAPLSTARALAPSAQVSSAHGTMARTTSASMRAPVPAAISSRPPANGVGSSIRPSSLEKSIGVPRTTSAGLYSGPPPASGRSVSGEQPVIGNAVGGSGRPYSPTLGALPDLVRAYERGNEHQRRAVPHLREALRQAEQGQWTAAVAALQVLLTKLRDPRVSAERDRLKLKADEKNQEFAEMRVRAVGAVRAKDFRTASDLWSKVSDAAPSDLEAAVHAAASLMHAGDVRRAGPFAKRAVDLAPKNLDAHRLLLRYFEVSGMQENAAQERQIVKSLSPW